MFQLQHPTLQTMKMIFHGILIGTVTYALIRRSFISIPSDWLFFFTSGAVENFVCAGIAYASYYVIIHLNGNAKKIGLTMCFMALLLALASLKDYRIHASVTFEQTFGYFTSFVGQSLLFYVLVFLINRFEQFRRYHILDKELSQAKEQLLRNQLHPHFLYNAFNSLYSLSLKSDPETPDYILKLSSMMRYLTDDTHRSKVQLGKEIDFIEKYIAIEKIRFGEDARIQLSASDASLDEKWIEPFLLITLVENAFKHGFYTNMRDAFVKITVRIETNELLFTVENSVFEKQHFQENNRDGRGLVNLKKRLELLYPKTSSIAIVQTPTSYTSHLKIKLNDEPV